MATNDKHCQTFCVKSEKIIIHSGEVVIGNYARGMYDESIPVNAPEIESPLSSDNNEKSDDNEKVAVAMSKFTQPVRHTARHDFDSESESESEEDKLLSDMTGEDQSPDRKTLSSERSFDTAKKLPSEKGRSRSASKPDSSSSESDSADLEPEKVESVNGSGRKRGGNGGSVGGVVIPAEGAYDPKQFLDLKVPPEMENIFQYIMKYTPQKIDIQLKLQPFVPDYVPAVGDIDAFIKVTTPTCNVRGEPLDERVLDHIDNLGLTILDEPSTEQSDSALLHLQLRAISKISNDKSTVVAKKVEDAERNPKAIDRWIKDVSELHLSKPAPTVNYTSKMPDIDSLMEEWPELMEEKLNEVGFPPAHLDCTLSQYVDLVCGLFDIPIAGNTLNDRIQALHVLFSLYSAVKNSQLYAERQKEKLDGPSPT